MYSQSSEVILNGAFTVSRDQNPSRIRYGYYDNRGHELITIHIQLIDPATAEKPSILKPVMGWSSLMEQTPEQAATFCAAFAHAIETAKAAVNG